MTAGRLSDNNLATIVDACASWSNKGKRVRCMQQLIVTTGEFHSTNLVTQSEEVRNSRAALEENSEPYKAIVYFYLDGALLILWHTQRNEMTGIYHVAKSQ